ncbi:HipA family kinase [Vallicoccus soli]|uniref:Aminotransferase class I and II n=1 Tax=Vallicoccus soli TaxID=2339232 RepID=A0A3A3ZLU5_9ACTN|nr:HipA family kinase [Vallicoccus soli]RJK97505.1 aminotransferase class I and II [Vallicoccus soli]
MRTVVATRYLAPLREGGSLPGLVEADDLGTYVVKFRGAGQGRKALVAEVVAGELARALGLRVPELVVVDLDPAFAPGEPDEEVQDLLRASPGHNLGMDYLPGSFGFDPVADRVPADEAARVAWFDGLVQNVDRSWRNPNLLRWHGDLWLIDHGASLYFHHDWRSRERAAGRPYPAAAEHVLLGRAGPLQEAHDALAPRVPEVLPAVLSEVPDGWLADEPGFDGPDDVRAAYLEVLGARAAAPAAWLPAMEAARAARR